MGFDVVQEVAVLIFGADEADPVQGGVVSSVLLGLHLEKETLAFMESSDCGQEAAPFEDLKTERVFVVHLLYFLDVLEVCLPRTVLELYL